MNRLVGAMNIIIIFLLFLFFPIIQIPKATVGGAFLNYFSIFVVYVVFEYATILSLNDEILDIRPPEKIFKTVKVKPFFRCFLAEYNHRHGSPFLVVFLQFLIFPVVWVWLIGLSWLTLKFISGSFPNVVESWEKIDTIVLMTMGAAMAITNITRYTVLIYCSCKKYPRARDYWSWPKIDWAEIRNYRKDRKKLKDLEWQVNLINDLKRSCTKKYKGVIFVYQRDLNSLEAMILKKYPKARTEHMRNEKKQYIWRVYYEEETLFELPIKK